ncbi:MAG: hypothetical protein R3F31_03380 [Verrucomicrobiales bacterium]
MHDQLSQGIFSRKWVRSRDPDPAMWLVTEEVLVWEFQRDKAAKEKHVGRKSGT